MKTYYSFHKCTIKCIMSVNKYLRDRVHTLFIRINKSQYNKKVKKHLKKTYYDSQQNITTVSFTFQYVIYKTYNNFADSTASVMDFSLQFTGQQPTYYALTVGTGDSIVSRKWNSLIFYYGKLLESKKQNNQVIK